jgi:hypothetical protein
MTALLLRSQFGNPFPTSPYHTPSYQYHTPSQYPIQSYPHQTHIQTSQTQGPTIDRCTDTILNSKSHFDTEKLKLVKVGTFSSLSGSAANLKKLSTRYNKCKKDLPSYPHSYSKKYSKKINNYKKKSNKCEQISKAYSELHSKIGKILSIKYKNTLAKYLTIIKSKTNDEIVTGAACNLKKFIETLKECSKTNTIDATYLSKFSDPLDKEAAGLFLKYLVKKNTNSSKMLRALTKADPKFVDFLIDTVNSTTTC